MQKNYLKMERTKYKGRFNYVYVTINLINGKQYVGDHSTTNINDGYIGSGIIFWKAVKRYGRENFMKTILQFYPTKQDAFNAQEEYIIKYDTLAPFGYNLSPKGGLHVKGCHSDATRKRISESQKGKVIPIEQRKQIAETLMGNIPWNKGKKGVLSDESRRKMSASLKGRSVWNKGKKATPEAILHQSLAHKGKAIPIEQRIKISKAIKKNIAERGEHWSKGSHQTEEVRKRIGDSMRGIPKSDEMKLKLFISKKGQKHSEETKRKISETKKRNRAA